MRATRATIHIEKFRSNLRKIKAHVGPNVKICMTVKADAYGHGAAAMAEIGREENVYCLGVATVNEGIELRASGFQLPILLFSLPVPEEIADIAGWGLSPFIASSRLADDLSRAAGKIDKSIAVHLKIDTGMGRIGCSPEDAPHIAERVVSLPHLTLSGVCTHFPESDARDKTFTRNQLSIFNRCIQKIKAKGIDPGILHTANSGAIIDLPDSYFHMVRPGIILYGYYPSKEQDRTIAVQPVMELKTNIVQIKRVGKGTPISYGMTHRTERETTIATLPVGYADGYNRLLSNRGYVAVKGKKHPVVGRVCMDQCMIDLGAETNVKLHDEVTLMGAQPPAPDAWDLADLVQTIPHEITCWVGKRVPRVYVKE